MMNKFSPYWLWALLCVPSIGMLSGLMGEPPANIFERLLHPSGEFSARFLIIAMLASPLCLLLRGWRGPLWLRKNRRYFGVASFGYALLHTVFYLIDKGSFGAVLSDVSAFYIWTGWLAFVIFVPLAITSTDGFVRAMGPRWKTLQRTTYYAAVFTLLHWASLHDWNGVTGALVHFGPLILLEAYRFWFWYLRPKSVRS